MVVKIAEMTASGVIRVSRRCLFYVRRARTVAESLLTRNGALSERLPSPSLDAETQRLHQSTSRFIGKIPSVAFEDDPKRKFAD